MEAKTSRMVAVRVGITLVFLSSVLSSFSQNAVNCDLRFIDHLVNIGDYEEALFEIDSSACSAGQSNDSVNYLRGWSLYSLNRLLASSENLKKVTAGSEFYLKSRFFAAYNYSHTGNYINALEEFSKIEVKNEKQVSLRNYEIAGVYLLQGNYDMFESYFSKTNRNQYEISGSSDNLQRISDDMKNHKKKSRLISGLMSAFVPGSGKYYSGRKGAAISSFIATTGLGLITWENYRKSGIKSFKTIAFGTAFAFSYFSNIYGAVMSVSLVETEYRDNVKSSILFNLHIPLRNSFSK
jgi:tetratricopeptide (TPR) repeat protein